MANYKKKPVIYGININQFVFDEKRIDTMPPERAKNIRSYRFIDDKKRSLAAGLLLETVLGRVAAFNVRRHDNGKPYLDGGPHFSISHSGDWAVIAVCEEALGFDIESFNTSRDTDGIARRAFTVNELEAASRDVKMFYKTWTAKESYLKMLGSGVRNMAGFSVQITGSAGYIKSNPAVRIRFFEHIAGYTAAVCSPDGIDWPSEIRALEA
ncbi:MAG: 4'-phosphopantetheinyl transferase superfamily protein [Treponema sp.]|jgi:4'-phosphopantetheinyl transferase|nr:4'-phosphopantetheinyl transferase superfamily protein [Treponema sp.]